MKNNLTCEIVEDLMPSYIDGLTSEVTNKAVRDHLSHCDRCSLTALLVTSLVSPSMYDGIKSSTISQVRLFFIFLQAPFSAFLCLCKM